MADYRLNDPRQGIIGPVRLDTVRDLVLAGVIQDDVLVSRDGGPFEALSSFPEISAQPRARSTPKASYGGDLGKNSFFRVFYRFHLARVTGLLTVKDPPRQKDIYLEDGAPIFVASNIEDERLGQFFVRHNVVDADDLEVALEAMGSDNNRLGPTLLRLGLVDATQLERVLVAQQVERLVDLCHWQTGRYLFFDGARHEGQKHDLHIVPRELILTAARRLDGALLAERLRPHLEAVIVRERAPELGIDDLTLTAVEARALTLIDGKHTLAALAREFTDPEERRSALALVYLLWETDAATFAAPRR
jgi:hypothetical protein